MEVYDYRNKRFGLLTSEDSLNNPNSCPVNDGGRQLLQDDNVDMDLGDFVKLAGVWVLVSCALSCVMGLLFLWLCKRSPEGMVNFTVGFQIAMPLVAAIAAFGSGVWIPGIVLVAFAALVALTFWLWRQQLELVAKLMKVSAQCLNDNPAIIWFVLLLQLGAALLCVPLLFSIMVAFMNGRLGRSSKVASTTATMCFDSDGQQVNCCEWKVEGWVPAYVSFAGLTMLWTTFLAFEIKVFTIAGSIAQWYFTPNNRVQGTTWLSFKHAMGPSFGSLALGSAILTLVQLLRQALEKARQDSREQNVAVAIVMCILSVSCRVVLSCVYTLIEFVTKFATVRMAITGEAFFAAGRSVVDLLARNFLDAFGVWWLPPMILQCCSFALSVAWGVIIGLISYGWWEAHGNSQSLQAASLLGLIAGIFCLLILSFLTSIILNILDAVYVCFAMDKDNRMVTRLEVHTVYTQLPSKKVGPVVENPDGQLAYAAPQVQYEPHYAPPSAPPAVGPYRHS